MDPDNKLAAMPKEERLAVLRRLAEVEGLSAMQVGEMYGASRNSVLGYAHRAKPKIRFASGGGVFGNKVHKHGGGRPPKSNLPKAAAPRVAHRALPKVALPATPPPAGLEPTGTLLTTERGRCHFPMFSDAQLLSMPGSQLPYCARDTGDPDAVYCPGHRAVMYSPVAQLSKRA